MGDLGYGDVRCVKRDMGQGFQKGKTGELTPVEDPV